MSWIGSDAMVRSFMSLWINLPKRARERQYEVVGRHRRDFGCCQTGVLRQNVEIVNVSHTPLPYSRRAQAWRQTAALLGAVWAPLAFQGSVNEQTTFLFQ